MTKLDDYLSTVLYGGFIALVTYISAEEAKGLAPVFYGFFALSVVVLGSNLLRVAQPDNSIGGGGTVNIKPLVDELQAIRTQIDTLAKGGNTKPLLDEIAKIDAGIRDVVRALKDQGQGNLGGLNASIDTLSKSMAALSAGLNKYHSEEMDVMKKSAAEAVRSLTELTRGLDTKLRSS